MLEFLIESDYYISLLFELLAAISGIIYLRKCQKVRLEIKLFVYYLILIFFLELYGLIPIWAWLDNYETLPFLKDSVFRRNLWWANSLRIISTLCISNIYIKFLSDRKQRKILTWLVIGFVIFSIVSYSTFGEFFNAYDPYAETLGVFVFMIVIGHYYFEILKSDKILNFYADLRFYISVGILLWSLCIIPIEIYSTFFSTKNPLFIEMNLIFFQYATIALYSIYTLGFFMDYRFTGKNAVALS